MAQVWLNAALWLGIAHLATLPYIQLRMSSAHSELSSGRLRYLILGAAVGSAVLRSRSLINTSQGGNLNRLISVRALAQSNTDRGSELDITEVASFAQFDCFSGWRCGSFDPVHRRGRNNGTVRRTVSPRYPRH
jgi:hypothetical protein